MSISELKAVECPHCFGSNKIVFYSSISPSSDESLRNSLLNDTLFKYTCIHCGYEARLSYPVLYNDVNRRFMIYFIPWCDKRVITDRVIEYDRSRIAPIKKRVVADYNSLKEKIIIFESGLDDMAIELTKLALKIKTEKKLGIHTDCGYFSFYDRRQIGFTFFDADTKEKHLETAGMQVYQKSLGIAARLGRKLRMSKAFINVDSEWAKEILHRYQRYGFDE